MKNMKLLAARDSAGLTQRQAAEKANITEQAYQRYEYGAEPRARMAVRVARAVESTVEAIWGEEQGSEVRTNE